MYCSKCGQELPDNVAFCSACGAPTARADLNHSTKSGKEFDVKKHIKKRRIQLIIAAILVSVSLFGSYVASTLSMIPAIIMVIVNVFNSNISLRYGVNMFKPNDVEIKTRDKQTVASIINGVIAAVIIMAMFIVYAKKGA
ncbi:MAG: zinc ribbon domain-containing protein [Acetatifactor sp.]|nr:zinc ribbon domain-containing protein [Acetatifactor sp.]